MKKLLSTLVIVAALGTAGYWYYSPYVALHGMKAAAEAKDADKLNAYIDYPKLRENLKGEFTARVASELPKESGDSMASAGAAMGMALGMALVDKFIDAMVRPEFVMRAMSEGRLAKPGSEGANPKSSNSAEKKEIDWSLERKTNDLVVAYGKNPEGPDERIGVVLERTGFAAWKMTGVRLPN